MTISVRLKEERSRLKLSQTDLGAAGGVGKTTQINYEKGVGSPDAKYLAAAASLGVDVLYVITGEHRLTSSESITTEEAGLLEFYRAMADSDRQSLMRMAYALAKAV
ncbi:transcriptional regulator [Pseudomonas frederiksbergensis]|uniref:Transcriptional regulator n=1 Tax=Pseudomonas frederiksbergensis TaxID=104087 RepID=A0A1J0EH25_9PSED|nr:helix-turn-helix transcriptional regulator [Pseudomonas frederiksbergensis]APC15116.1 transcriptional regulator [Pseudomonas frederiksbergensis]